MASILLTIHGNMLALGWTFKRLGKYAGSDITLANPRPAICSLETMHRNLLGQSVGDERESSQINH